MRSTRAMASIAMLALGGMLLATGPAAAIMTAPDDPHIPPCADFNDMYPGRYVSSYSDNYAVWGEPGSATNPATFTFQANLWSDVNADRDGSGAPACGDVTYTMYLYGSDDSNATTPAPVATMSYQSNQGTSPQTSFEFSQSWCPELSAQTCTLHSTPPRFLYYYLTTSTSKRNGKPVLLDQAPAVGYAKSKLNQPPGTYFH